MRLFTATYAGKRSRIGWLNLQQKGDISIGLSDRTFISPDFHARNFIFNVYNRVLLRYEVPNSPGARKAVQNPHLTFHAPAYFHLRANGERELFAGWAEVDLVIQQDGIFPWVRFVSKPFESLSAAGLPRDPGSSSEFQVSLSTADCSIGIGLDFVRSDAKPSDSGLILSELIAWHGRTLHVQAVQLPAQQSTLSWYHQK